MNKLKNIAIATIIFLFPFSANAQGWNPGSLGGFGLPSAPIFIIVQGFLFWLLTIFGILAVIGFVISGVMYIMASGDEDTMKKAKRAMIYSITGVVVALSGLVIIYAINNILRASPIV